jgi:hypothetical protein
MSVMLRGVVPAERPTPAPSSRITSREWDRVSTSSGSQFSRLPRKYCRKSRGGLPLPRLPKRRYANSVPQRAL